MTPDARQIVFENVSKFYGEVLGVNKVSFSLHPGITSLVGPNPRPCPSTTHRILPAGGILHAV